MRFVDVHCHLHFTRVSKSVDSIIQRAHEYGIERFVVNATAEEDWKRVEVLASRYPSIIPSYGIHPYAVGDEKKLDALKQFCSSVRTPYAIGEIGMDKSISRQVSIPLQRHFFEEQVKFAKEHNVFFTVHCVKCTAAVYEVLSTLGPFPNGFIMHGYSGPPDFVMKFAELGGYFSVSGYYFQLGPNRQKAMEDAIRKIPQDRLLFESDAPDMTAIEEALITDDEGNKANTPNCIPYVLKNINSKE